MLLAFPTFNALNLERSIFNPKIAKELNSYFSPCWKLYKIETLRDRMSAIGLLVMLQASCLLLESRRLEDQLPSRAPAASSHSHSLLALQELINEEL